MDKAKIFLDGIEKEVDGIFYLYDSKYYFIYTEKEIDENGYVVLHVVKVAKEIKTTPDGPLDTGYMIGVEISDVEEWKQVQTSISEIVEDKKNSTQNPKIQYLPISMLSVIKIVSKKTFRLMKDIIENNFKLQVAVQNDVNPIIEQQNIIEPIVPIIPNTETQIQPAVNITSNMEVPVQSVPEIQNDIASTVAQTIEVPNMDTPVVEPITENGVIIDYRSKFFEEQEKNKQLQSQIDELTKKLNSVKEIIE